MSLRPVSTQPGLRMAADLARARRPPRPWLAEATLKMLRSKPLGVLGLAIVLTMVFLAAFGPQVAPHPYDTSIAARNLPPASGHLLGTDYLGRDLLSRLIYGARASITVGFGAVGLATVLAVAIGATSGYFGGRWDILVQRVVDAFQSFPALVILLSIVAVLGQGLLNIILALAILGTAANSRVVRSATLATRENQYIEGARAVGAGSTRILLTHILPNVMPVVLVIATVGLGQAIIAEASLSFLGLGVPPPFPTWGGMLSGLGVQNLRTAPWGAIFPGLFLSATVFGFNMLGDALRDVLDPRLRGT